MGLQRGVGFDQGYYQNMAFRAVLSSCLVILFGYAVLTLAIALPLSQPPFFLPGPQVDLGYSTYVGRRRLDDVDEFLGMRYASPPVGDGRWRAPVEPERDGKIHNALAVCFPVSSVPVGTRFV